MKKPIIIWYCFLFVQIIYGQIEHYKFEPSTGTITYTTDPYDPNRLYWNNDVKTNGLRVRDFDVWGFDYPEEIYNYESVVLQQTDSAIVQWNEAGCIQIVKSNDYPAVSIEFSKDGSLFPDIYSTRGRVAFAVDYWGGKYTFHEFTWITETQFYQTDIYLNSHENREFDWSVTMQQPSNPFEITPVYPIILHEIGHLIGLPHHAYQYGPDGPIPTVMSPGWVDPYVFELTEFDNQHVAHVCEVNDTPVGIEDYIYISSYEPVVYPHELFTNFTAIFVDEYPYGDYLVDGPHWEMKARHADGLYTVPGGPRFFSDLPNEYCWLRDENGNVIADVSAYGTDNGGIFHISYVTVGIDNVPDNTVITASGTINSNKTWCGSVSVTGTVTLPVQKRLRILEGTSVYFSNGTSLIINGKLYADGTPSSRITFTSTGGTSPSTWGSIVLDGLNTTGSSITHADILYGTTAVHAINTTDITVRYCNLIETNRGVHLYNATASIRDNIITSSSTSHAILLQYSNSKIYDNVITKSNQRGAGIMFNSGSGGYAVRNDISGMDWGIGVIWGSSASSYTSSPMDRRNRVRNNKTGLMVYREGYLNFGTPAATEYFAYNSIYNNNYNARVGTSYTSYPSTLYAYYNWWGTSPPDESKFMVGPNATFRSALHLTSDPWTGIPKIASVENSHGTISETGTLVQSNGTEKGKDTDDYLWLYEGIKLLYQNKYRQSMEHFMSHIRGNPHDQAAYVYLYNCYSDETADDLIAFFSSLPREASGDHKLLLSYLYLKKHPDEKGAQLARAVNNKLLKEYPGTSLAAKVELNNIYIALYVEHDFERAVNLFNEGSRIYELLTEEDIQLTRSAIENYAEIYNKQKPDLRVEEPLHGSLDLMQNYPNPFNPITVISFVLPSREEVTLRIYDILGRMVAVLADGVYEAGRHEVIFDGDNLSSGMYFYTLTTSQQLITKRFILMK